MMCPDPLATMDGSTARLHRNGPRTLTACTWSQSCTGVWWQVVAARDPVIPALLTSTSMGPAARPRVHCSRDRVLAGDVAGQASGRVGGAVGLHVQRGHGEAVLAQPGAGRQADAGRPAGDHRDPRPPRVPPPRGPRSQVDRVELACAQPAELDEVLRVEDSSSSSAIWSMVKPPGWRIR